MSTISKALQKAQQALEDSKSEKKTSSNKPPKKKKPKPQRDKKLIIRNLICISAVVTLAAASFGTTYIYRKYHAKQERLAQQAQLQKKRLAISKLKHHILNGTMIMNNNRLAVIDDHPYHKGDLIDNMSVNEIDESKVILSSQNKIQMLSVKR